MAELDLFKVKVIDRYSSFLEKGLTLAKRRRLTYHRVKIGSAVLAAPSSKSVISFKKRTNPYMLGICTSVPENFSETKFRSMT